MFYWLAQGRFIERLAEYGWKPPRDCCGSKRPITGLNLLVYAWKTKGYSFIEFEELAGDDYPKVLICGPKRGASGCREPPAPMSTSTRERRIRRACKDVEDFYFNVETTIRNIFASSLVFQCYIRRASRTGRCPKIQRAGSTPCLLFATGKFPQRDVEQLPPASRYDGNPRRWGSSALPVAALRRLDPGPDPEASNRRRAF